MASKTKIYIVLELIDGGELFDKIVSRLFISCYIYIYLPTISQIFFLLMGVVLLEKLSVH